MWFPSYASMIAMVANTLDDCQQVNNLLNKKSVSGHGRCFIFIFCSKWLHIKCSSIVMPLKLFTSLQPWVCNLFWHWYNIGHITWIELRIICSCIWMQVVNWPLFLLLYVYVHYLHIAITVFHNIVGGTVNTVWADRGVRHAQNITDQRFESLQIPYNPIIFQNLLTILKSL